MDNSLAIENLKTELTGSRPRAPTTLLNYMSQARQFMEWLGHEGPPTRMEFHRYFQIRREQGLKASSLAHTFVVIKKLFEANDWKWPFSSRDMPVRPKGPQMPAHTYEELAAMIRAWPTLSEVEAFFLALASTFGPRREELAVLDKPDFKADSVLIHTAKGGDERRHLIPPEILPVVKRHRVKPHGVRGLTDLYKRICLKGLGEKMPGYGFHSIRYTTYNLVLMELVKASLDPSLAADYFRWAKTTMGKTFFGTPMAGFYRRPEVVFQEEFGLDKVVLEVHPFPRLWAPDGDGPGEPSPERR